MKVVRFEKPGALVVEYKRAKDGPPHFLVWTPGTARICMDRKAVLKAVRWPVKTATGDALRAWLDEITASSLPASSSAVSDPHKGEPSAKQ